MQSKFLIINEVVNLYRLCQILTVLSGSSIECERGFSNLNRIKGEERNHLNGDNLRYLMRISSLKLSNEELDAIHMPELILRWKRQKERRLTRAREDILLTYKV